EVVDQELQTLAGFSIAVADPAQRIRFTEADSKDDRITVWFEQTPVLEIQLLLRRKLEIVNARRLLSIHQRRHGGSPFPDQLALTSACARKDTNIGPLRVHIPTLRRQEAKGLLVLVEEEVV